MTDKLNAALKEIYEIWAGSEGIPLPTTAPEAYLLRLIEQMRDVARDALRATLKQPQQEQPEQELKPLNGLTKEEALAWARGLRADSPEYCSCGDRPKGHCPGEWEPGCDLGNNPAFARRGLTGCTESKPRTSKQED